MLNDNVQGNLTSAADRLIRWRIVLFLAGIAFQKELERAAKRAGGGGQVAPGQRLVDFLARKE